MGFAVPLAIGLEIAIESLEILLGQQTRYADICTLIADRYIIRWHGHRIG
jgi:hypothetical protein